MDKAQILSEPYLKIGKIFSDLSETLESPESSIAGMLLQRIELHRMELHCPCFMVDDPGQQFKIPLPEHFVNGFLQSVADGNELSEIHYQETFNLCANGSWETFSREDLTALGEQVIGHRVCNLPFSEFEVPRPEFENRLKASDVSIPPKWLGRDSVADDGLQRHVEWAFYKADGVWNIGPLDNIQILRDSIGLQHIHFLLVRPNKLIEATYLYADTLKLDPEVVDGPTVKGGIKCAEDGNWDYVPRYASSKMSYAFNKTPNTVLRGEGYGIVGDGIMDKRARREINKKVEELEEERARLDESGLKPELSPEDALEERQERIAELEEQIARYRSYIDSATHFDGKDRQLLALRSEKSRKAVFTNIARAYKKIEQAHSGIHGHLRQSIQTGNTVVYRPQDPCPKWVLSPPESPS